MRRLLLVVLALAATPSAAVATTGFGAPEPVDPFFATDDTFTGRQLQVDSAGRALFVSREDVVVDAGEGTTDRQVVVYERCGTAWRVSRRLGNTDSGGSDTFPEALLMSPAGDAIVVWREGNAFSETIYSSFRPAGGTWGAAEAIDTLDLGGSVMADIAPNGDVVIAYRAETFPTAALLVAARPKATGTWVKETLAEVTAVRAVAMTQAADAVVLTSTGSAPAQLASFHRPAGGAWGTAQSIGQVAGSEAPTRIVGLPDGKVLLAVGELDSSGLKDRVRYATRAAGAAGAWSALADVPGSTVATSDGAISDLDLVRHPAGAVAAWVKRDSGNFDEDAAVARYSGGAFETAQTYSLDQRFVFVAAAADADGRSLLAAQHSGPDNRIRVAVAEAGGAWPAQTSLLSPDAGDRREPVAAGGGSLLAVAWGVHGASGATTEAVATAASPACPDGSPGPGGEIPLPGDPPPPGDGPPPPGDGPPPPGGGPPPPLDVTAPTARIAKVRYAGGRVRFILRLDEAAKVTIGLDGRRLAVRQLSAGKHRMSLKSKKRLRRGKHRLSVKAVDPAGNAAATLKRRFRR